MRQIYLILLSILAGISCTTKTEITTGTLLMEMIDREQLTRYPNPEFTLKQYSSYDRNSIAPDQPGWFANADRSQFIRKEVNDGRREFVVFEADGPGAIVRLWITVALYEGNGMFRFYLDHESEPVLEGEVLSLISGGGIVDGPLATSVSELTEYIKRGHNLYLPIPYSKHCKITYESEGIDEVPGAKSGEAFYYNINYRTYNSNVGVTSFSRKDLETFADEIKTVQESIINFHAQAPTNFQSEKTESKNLVPDQSVEIEIAGTRAIHEIVVKIDASEPEQALRSSILELEFDGQRTVWCPIGDFYGTGYKLSAFTTWYSNVDTDGTMTCKWIMPFVQNAKIRINNEGSQEVSIEKFEVKYADYSWMDNSMHFGAGWHELDRLSSKTIDYDQLQDGSGCFDINYVELTGKGVLVGNGVTLYNTTDAWWGEGDEKVFVDHEKFPSHFGTGSEDFYGYAWSNPNSFDHPFIAQPDGTGADKPGYAVNLRYRSLDVIPFLEHLKFDMEMWHQSKTIINYAPVSYWYMLPGGSSNIGPDPVQAKKSVALSRLDFYLDGFPERNIFINETTVQINGIENGFEIRYTVDGSTPTEESKLYKRPFTLSNSATIKAKGFSGKGYTTEILEGEFINQQPLQGINLKSPEKGISYQYFELDDVLQSTSQLEDLDAMKSGFSSSISFPTMDLPLKFGLIFNGFVYVKKAGVYSFSTKTNDGSMLYIHDQLVVSNDGPHGARERSGEIALDQGFHPIRMEYIQIGGTKHLEVFVQGPGIKKQELPGSDLFH